MHIFNMSTTGMQGFRKIHTVKGDERMDRQMDRQGQILMPPDYRHRGITK